MLPSSLQARRNVFRLVHRTKHILQERETAIVKRYASSPTTTKSSSKLPKKAWDHNSPLMSDQRFLGMSLAELAGNVSFLCATAAYLSTDVLMLRGLAMSGMGMGIIFQFYRPAPLWIPIRWNFFLMAINGAMVSTLLLERHLANSMPPELEQLFLAASFEKRGFSRVEFCKLFRVGRQVRHKAGAVLAKDGKKISKLYLVTEGHVSIQRKGSEIAKITNYHFVGELAFLIFGLDREADAEDRTSPCASADAIVESGGAVIWEWDFEELCHFLQNEREVTNALSAYINHDLRQKLIDTGISVSDLDNVASKRKSPQTEKK